MNTGLVPAMIAGIVVTLLLCILAAELNPPPRRVFEVRHVVVRGHWVAIGVTR